jgi:hypothetical protein
VIASVIPSDNNIFPFATHIHSLWRRILWVRVNVGNTKRYEDIDLFISGNSYWVFKIKDLIIHNDYNFEIAWRLEIMK